MLPLLSALLARPLPGPSELPLLGSPDFLSRSLLLQQPLSRLLPHYRAAYGPIFTIKTGPIRQVWISNDKMSEEAYTTLECSGRSQLPPGETPFGQNFLFLIRDPQRAQPVRRSQKEWLKANAGTRAVCSAVRRAEPELLGAIDAAVSRGKGEGMLWPSEEVGTAMLGALLLTFGGKEMKLGQRERSELLTALAGYRRRAGAPRNPFTTKLDYAKQVREILTQALASCGRTHDECEEMLPLLVSACVGGGEIFPLLLQWSARRLALEPGVQQSLRREMVASADGPEYGKAMPRVLAAIMRQCPYSLAIGPPRKALADFAVQGYTVPEGSLVFVMHPGVIEPDVSQLPSLADACGDDRQVSAQWMFGAGLRSCTAAETSVALLCSALATILSKYEISAEGINTEGEKADLPERLLRYKSDGSLLVPAVEVPLIFRRVPSPP